MSGSSCLSPAPAGDGAGELSAALGALWPGWSARYDPAGGAWQAAYRSARVAGVVLAAVSSPHPAVLVVLAGMRERDRAVRRRTPPPLAVPHGRLAPFLAAPRPDVAALAAALSARAGP